MKHRHIISWKVKGETPEEMQVNIGKITKALRAFLDANDITNFSLGPSLGIFPREGGGQDIALVVELPNRTAVDGYYALFGTESGHTMDGIVKELVVDDRRSVIDMVV